jgi:hypothetical protein
MNQENQPHEREKEDEVEVAKEKPVGTAKRTAKRQVANPPLTKRRRLFQTANAKAQGEASAKSEAGEYQKTTINGALLSSGGLEELEVAGETASLGPNFGLEELLPAELVALVLYLVGPLSWPCCSFVCRRSGK